jgi:hypothetical protein
MQPRSVAKINTSKDFIQTKNYTGQDKGPIKLQAEWEESATIKKIYIFSSVPTSLSYCALLTKIPSTEIQGSKYGGQTPKKALEYIA